uniref:Uncharacterized protein n=1 Tax=Oryza punctata TaxID=4537 RepID=A0A0E0K6F9_ORYPU
MPPSSAGAGASGQPCHAAAQAERRAAADREGSRFDSICTQVYGCFVAKISAKPIILHARTTLGGQ